MEAAVTSKSGGERAATHARTIAEAFRLTAAERAGDVAIRTKGDEFTITWGALRERVDALAGGLHKLGLRRGDTLALMIGNRPEFHLCDLAGMMVGAAPFSIYSTYTAEQIAYLLKDAGARIVICEQEYLPRIKEAQREVPTLEYIVVIDGDAPIGTLALSEIEGSNPDFDIEASVAAIEPNDILTLIYTSGTTGPPKGVQLIHRNLLAAVEGLDELIEFPMDGRVISWLPSAHVAERNAHHYLPIVYGLQITCCEDPRQVLSYLPEVRPSWFFAVPRIWEKLKAGLETMMAGQPPEQREVMETALAAAIEKVRLEQRGEAVPAELAEQVAKADAEIFSGLRTMLGLDQVEAINVGAAPTPVEVLEFFHAIGLPLAELWGMSETCGAGSVNPPGKIRIGTVGPPAPGVEIKLDTDGEVLIRSEVVMLGYRNLPEKTAEAFTEDGWMRTGDIGEFDEAGYLKIVDRKKELIISAGGKNMSPANIEATLKTASPLIGQACTIGDMRPYNTALIVLDADFAPMWASQQGIEDTSLEALASNEKVRAAVEEGVKAANEKLAKVEQIKKFTIVEGDWLPGGDELTPTMKLKRKPIAEKYTSAIEGMYSKLSTPGATAERAELQFPSGGAQCAAWLYRPPGDAPAPDGGLPCVVMAHGFSLTRHDGLEAYAEKLAEAGAAVLVFDHRYLGDSGGMPRQRFRKADQLTDWRAAVDHARGLEGIDPSRIILWGFSFSGGHVIETAAADPGIAATIALCPMVDGLARALATPPLLSAWLIPRALADQFGRHTLVPVTGQPGEHAAMTLAGEADGFAAAVPAGSPWRNEISPAVFLSVAMHRPLAKAGRIAGPVWVGLGEQDISVSKRAVERLAERLPRGELHRYPYDHFGAFLGDGPARVAVEQIDFLRRRGLLAPAAVAA